MKDVERRALINKLSRKWRTAIANGRRYQAQAIEAQIRKLLGK